jgi:outer membrane lipoprotein-sorting protein
MNKQNNKKPLDELISRAVGRENLKFDFSKWKVQNQKEIQDFQVEMEHSAINNPVLTNIWRTIMKSSITKFAAAAVIIIAVVLSITFLDKSVTPAYGIEQTIEAFRNVNSVYVEAITRGEANTSLNLKMWARRGEDGKFFFGDFRQESSYGDTIVANEREDLTYCYYPSTKKVYVYEGLTETIGSFLDINFFLWLQGEMKDVKIEYGKDEVTGKEIVSLSYKETGRYQKSASKCGVIIFDLESKLPSRIKLWDNPDSEGDPFMVWTLIVYNPKVREDIFKFEIPEDVTIIRD